MFQSDVNHATEIFKVKGNSIILNPGGFCLLIRISCRGEKVCFVETQAVFAHISCLHVSMFKGSFLEFLQVMGKATIGPKSGICSKKFS